MKLAAIRQIALGTVFAASLVGCASEKPESVEASGNRPLHMTGGSPAAYDVDAEFAKVQSERHSGDLAKATQTLAHLMLVVPDEPDVLGEYGKILIAQGRNGEALAFLERAVELKPDEWSLQSAKGVACDLTGDHLGAQVAYERALALKPGEPTVLSNNAMSHMEVGDLDTAEKLLREASQTGTDPRIKQNLAMIQDMKSMRGTVTPVLAMAQGSGQADVALQPTMPELMDLPPAADPVPEAPVMMMVPELEAPADGPAPLESDQATRGFSIAYDPVLDEPASPAPNPAQAQAHQGQSPAKVAVTSSRKVSAKTTARAAALRN